MSARKVLQRRLGDAFVGWLAGIIATLALGVAWPIIFPAIVRVENYYGSGPGLPLIILMILGLASPGAALGGLIGGSLAIEGGTRGRRIVSILVAVILSLPCAAWGYWFFTGY